MYGCSSSGNHFRGDDPQCRPRPETVSCALMSTTVRDLREEEEEEGEEEGEGEGESEDGE